MKQKLLSLTMKTLVSLLCIGLFSFAAIQAQPQITITVTVNANYTYVQSGATTVNFTDISSAQIDITFPGTPLPPVATTPSLWTWDFGDGTTSSSQNPIHTYSAAGNYTVCLHAQKDTTVKVGPVTKTASGMDDTCMVINVTGVAPCATPGFSHTDYYTDVTFSDISSNGTATITQWLWDFGDGATSTLQNPPMHAYAGAGTYTVCQTVGDGGSCSKQICQPITLNQNPCMVSFSATPDAVNDKEVDFVSGSTVMGIGKADTLKWDFGDGSPIDTGTTISHTYASYNTYTVCLTMVYNGALGGSGACTSQLCQTVTVAPVGISEEGKAIGYARTFPNPSNDQLSFEYYLLNQQSVEVLVYDLLGNVQSLVLNENQTKGVHTLHINTAALGSGVYLLRLKAGAQLHTERITIIK